MSEAGACGHGLEPETWGAHNVTLSLRWLCSQLFKWDTNTWALNLQCILREAPPSLAGPGTVPGTRQKHRPGPWCVVSVSSDY
ncbi:hypothetical protein Cadr_000029087 [Camelus dromedarius]|uniref:Uncharacterized protein n=1 Tax=Camelus dromedarius TaxID=9838 RepID=A0A5N4C713_CAMDR|nr:hypothetical protein Cadr_000029087 [Camelus dromedarius]